MNIAVFRALHLGDLLCAVPALRALKTEYPAARLTLVGLPWARAFVARFRRYVDDFAEFPGFPGTPEFFGRMRERRFDLVLQMHGDGSRTNLIALRMGGQRTAGFYRAGGDCPDRERFVEWRDEENEVLRHLRLTERLGVASQGAELEFPLEPNDWAEWQWLGLDAYVCLHAGAQLPSRRWPAERFAQIGDALAAQGLNVVLTGTGGEAGLTRQVAQAMHAPAVNLAGWTTLGGLGALIARARLVVSNDTSVSHIAAALHTPSVIVCCGADPRRWAPLDRELHRVIHHEVPCRPCGHAECPVGHPCAREVSAERVLAESMELLACAA